jgi:3',5'-cyclic AMP phosphodiesterase CpdA
MKVIAQVSDIHLGERIDEAPAIDPRANLVFILEDIKARGIDEIIITGDICSRDTADELKSMLEAYGLKYRFVLGNHDEIEDVGFYSFKAEGRTCLVLDSSRGSIDSPQLGWLEKELMQAEGGDVIIFIHHPILDCGSLMDKLYPLLNREDVEALINSSGKKGNIRQYVAPSAFYQLKPYGEKLEIDDIPIGYRIITFDEVIESPVVRI